MRRRSPQLPPTLHASLARSGSPPPSSRSCGHMRKIHFSHSWKTAAAEAAVKADRCQGSRASGLCSRGMAEGAAQRAERSAEPLRTTGAEAIARQRVREASSANRPRLDRRKRPPPTCGTWPAKNAYLRHRMTLMRRGFPTKNAKVPLHLYVPLLHDSRSTRRPRARPPRLIKTDKASSHSPRPRCKPL